MVKQSGLGDNLYVGEYNLSGDVGSLEAIAGGCSPLDVTGIDKSAVERIVGLRDGRMEFTTFFNDAVGGAHFGLRSLPRTDIPVTYFRGTTLGNPAASMVSKQIGYDPTRGVDGSLTFTVQCLANGEGLEWGREHTAGVRTDTAATNGTGVEHGGTTNFGLQAVLHVFTFSGTDVTVKLQQSTDNGAGDAYADVTGGGFTAVTATTSQRIATATNQAVESWLRVVTTTVAGFTSVSYAVNVVRNLETPPS